MAQVEWIPLESLIITSPEFRSTRIPRETEGEVYRQIREGERSLDPFNC